MFAATLLVNTLLASFALAAPSSRLAERLARRQARQSMPLSRLDAAENLAAGNVSHVEYSQNWSGAVWESYPTGTFKSVTGTFIVPTPSGSGSASAWVGIDGDTCGSAILQTGIDFNIQDGDVSYDAWYEWYPDYAYDFSGIPIHAGDSITLTVTASSTTTGTAVIINNTTGKKVSKSLSNSNALCLENAEWIVEDFEEGSSLVELCDFGTVKFTDAYATTESGETVGVSGASTIDLKQGSTVYTSVSTASEGLTVKYTGS
ncbi:hypothetical protein CONPUDRAFT_125822 [Coniophora puteana RWD-64-598 SS2]|uniref:Aspergillopepsin n=1 Tax=Coniophora puteana (strain RWD-64-598) TaxID=741705 RepID=A0A5M3MKB2_CONPW|nr:uncharacterized protein CONPUDRAFT_125822 [Coniophora puteana RWD-64-598 SS2]EIW79506.1 hypothetical protein CONPUDRAFT_125822 [Coniophora puteana RWD-64-598 SS2]